MSRILLKTPVIGASRDRWLLEGASTYIYHRTPQADLEAHVFQPDDPAAPATSPPRLRPAVVFFHGGLWDASMLSQFAPQCHRITARDAVAVIVETRVSGKHGASPADAVEDAREAVRWLRLHSAILEIDPLRVSAVGAAGGALLALLTAMPTDKALPPVDGVTCRPQALVLISAVVNTRPGTDFAGRFPDRATARALSPSSLVRSKLPPMLFLHGKADRIAPFAEVKRLRRRLRWRRNDCELIGYERADHSFFNFNVDHQHFELSTAALCAFLAARNLLDAEPEE